MFFKTQLASTNKHGDALGLRWRVLVFSFKDLCLSFRTTVAMDNPCRSQPATTRWQERWSCKSVSYIFGCSQIVWQCNVYGQFDCINLEKNMKTRSITLSSNLTTTICSLRFHWMYVAAKKQTLYIQTIKEETGPCWTMLARPQIITNQFGCLELTEFQLQLAADRTSLFLGRSIFGRQKCGLIIASFWNLNHIISPDFAQHRT